MTLMEEEMQQRNLGTTGFSTAPLVLGTNVFGWTADEQASFAILDAFVDHGFNTIDTADNYSLWVPGNRGGEAETIIGRWLQSRPGMRERIVLMTKVGWDLGRPGEKGLSRRWIEQGIEASLARLGVDEIDVYFSHQPDAETPVEETLATYADLLKAGKIKAIGASNHDAAQLEQALAVADEYSLPRYQVLQPQYNLYDRATFDGALRYIAVREKLGVVTYFSLASGFLTGKYRSKADLSDAARAGFVEAYLDDRGAAILSVLDEVAEAHGAKVAEVSLAWLMAREGVTAPIASATSVAQVQTFANAAALQLTAFEIDRLDKAGA